MEDGQNISVSVEELLRFIESSNQLTDEEKAELKMEMLKGRPEAAALHQASNGDLQLQLLILILLFTMVAAVLGAIAYSLIMKEKGRTDRKDKKAPGKEGKRKRK